MAANRYFHCFFLTSSLVVVASLALSCNGSTGPDTPNTPSVVGSWSGLKKWEVVVQTGTEIRIEERTEQVTYIFSSDGSFNFGYSSLNLCGYLDGTQGPCVGTWQQNGLSVTADGNKGLATYTATISSDGTRLTGNAINNRSDFVWSYELTRD